MKELMEGEETITILTYDQRHVYSLVLQLKNSKKNVRRQSVQFAILSYIQYSLRKGLVHIIQETFINLI